MDRGDFLGVREELVIGLGEELLGAAEAEGVFDGMVEGLGGKGLFQEIIEYT